MDTVFDLDSAFAALADPTRRAILRRLAVGEASVSELAGPFQMTQPAISQHLKVLEEAGLISGRVAGAKRPRRLEAAGIEAMGEWLARLEAFGRELGVVGRCDCRDAEEGTVGQAVMGGMRLETVGATDVVVTRFFAASPEAVYVAHTEPQLIQRWMLGLEEGWTMPVCVNEARAGGALRYEWARADGGLGMSMTGEILEIEPGCRIVQVERMILPKATRDGRVETRFERVEAGMLMTMRMQLPDETTRARMLAMGMEQGMEASYARLEGLM